jgi:delta(3,5)-delta(2,4)-dienoyl-CoA isomerase
LQRFPRIVGNDSWTRELAFSGRFFSAFEALERGFVSYVFDTREKAVDKALEIARVIARKSPVAVQGTKTLLNYSRDHTIREGISLRFVVDDRIGIYSVVELHLFTVIGVSPWWTS